MQEYAEVWAKAKKMQWGDNCVTRNGGFQDKKIFTSRQKQALYKARGYWEQSKPLNIHDYLKDQQNSFLKMSKRHLREY